MSVDSRKGARLALCFWAFVVIWAATDTSVNGMSQHEMRRLNGLDNAKRAEAPLNREKRDLEEEHSHRKKRDSEAEKDSHRKKRESEKEHDSHRKKRDVDVVTQDPIESTSQLPGSNVPVPLGENESHVPLPLADTSGGKISGNQVNKIEEAIAEQEKLSGKTKGKKEKSDDGSKKKNKDASKLKSATYEEFVENAKKNKKNNKDKENVTEDPVKKFKTALKEKQLQTLSFVLNTSRQADELQKTLKNHKLKLKSYMNVLRNLTEQHAVDKEKMQNYTKEVKDKVGNILNPKRNMENRINPEKAESSQKEGKHPKHLLSKNIPETLRARVDMKDLKKSEAFWDKKGEDVEDEHLANLTDSTDATTVAEEIIVEELGQDIDYPEQITIEGVADIISQQEDVAVDQQSPSVDEQMIEQEPEAAPLLLEEADSHIDDIHVAKLEEMKAARDRLTSPTQHETLLFNQVVSGRIHGNILAPPPERCSVKANMMRYRPPESQMDETDSLLYRVDLKPEIEKSLEGAPLNYLQDYKNPCWLSKITDDQGSLWYDYTETGLTYKRMSFLYEMRLSKNANWRMRCLPYVFLVGVTKSGTTDLYSRLMSHPEIMRPAHKEPMWWNRLTLGMAQSLRKPFRYYVDFFDEAAELMRRKVTMKDGKPYHPGITVDATPANLWDYDCWTDIPGNRGLAEPKYTLAHSVKKLVPDARIILILRQPTDRLYSQYRMKSHSEPSTTFHRQVVETVTTFNNCLETRTLRSCAYDHDLAKHEFGSPGGVFLRASLYYVFVKDWLEVFPAEQVKVIRTEDYQNNTADSLRQTFDFLGLSPLNDDRMAAITKQKEANTRADHSDRSLDPILPETQELLDDFFRPYNRKLARLLHDKKFLWSDVRE